MAEHEADGEIERVYHEIRQVLRVSGVNLNFRTWAAFDKFLPAMWDAMRAHLETRTFEDAADQVRREAVQLASAFPVLDALEIWHPGESQRHQIQASLDLYHYVNPKLLVLTCAVCQALDGEATQTDVDRTSGRIQLGEPPAMFPMEMAPEEPEDETLKATFDDIKKTLELPSINSDYRTLGLWPNYLEAAWRKLKPHVTGSAYRDAADTLRNSARDLARSFPINLTRERVDELGEDADAVVGKSRSFERLLPELILNIALCQLDWKPAEELVDSPFPATTAAGKEVA